MLVYPYHYQFQHAGSSALIRCCLPYRNGINRSSVIRAQWFFQEDGLQNKTLLQSTDDAVVTITTKEDSCALSSGTHGNFPDVPGYLTQLRQNELAVFHRGNYSCSYETTSHGDLTNSSIISVVSKHQCVMPVLVIGVMAKIEAFLAVCDL